MPGHATERCVTGVGFVTVLSALLIVLTAPTASAQTRTRLGSNRLARVYRLDLPAKTHMSVRPSTKHGLAWVAITDGIVEVAKVEQAVPQGAAEWQEGAEAVGFRPDGAKAATFVVVDLSAATEEIAIDNHASPVGIGPPDPNDPTKPRMYKDESLEPGQIIDVVHSPGELFVAVAPLTMKVQVNLAEEGDPDRWAKPAVLKLAAGGIHWMTGDNMLITNVGKTNARFVWIGWFSRPKLARE